MKLNTEFNQISGALDSLSIESDKNHINFVKGNVSLGTPIGSFYTDYIKKIKNGIEVKYCMGIEGNAFLDVFVTRRNLQDKYVETYKFVNNEKEDMEIKDRLVGFYLPMNDSFDIPVVTLNRRCNAHVWFGGNCCYGYGLKKDASENNIGFVLTKGYIDKYGVENKSKLNNRGDFQFILNKKDFASKEEYILEFEYFAFKNEREFFEKAYNYDTFINISSKSYAYSVDEKIEITIDRFIESATINDKEIDFSNTNLGAKIILENQTAGVKKLVVKYGGYETFAYFYVYENILKEIDSRINFIINKQQVDDRDNLLYGAYTLYDYEDKEAFVEKSIEKNSGNNRFIISCLIASRLLNDTIDKEFKEKLLESLHANIRFIRNNYVDDDGNVYDFINYKIKKRVHNKNNYGLLSNLFSLMYELTKNEEYLTLSFKIIEKFYDNDWLDFIPLTMPFVRMSAFTEKANNQYNLALKNMLKNHIEYLMAKDIAIYKEFTQDRLAKISNLALNAYLILNDVKYLEFAKSVIQKLSLMNGMQPDFRLRDIGIRYNDLIKNGRNINSGELFPHCLSVLSAEVYSLLGAILDEEKYINRADNILKNNLCLFDKGKGYLAYIYADYVNDNEGKDFELISNDQDIILYYILEYFTKFN